MEIKINAKCADLFAATLHDKGRQIGEEYSGYVPEFFPGQHWGDYVELVIDVETGQILNWTKPSKEDLEIFHPKSDEI